MKKRLSYFLLIIIIIETMIGNNVIKANNNDVEIMMINSDENLKLVFKSIIKLNDEKINELILEEYNDAIFYYNEGRNKYLIGINDEAIEYFIKSTIISQSIIENIYEENISIQKSTNQKLYDVIRNIVVLNFMLYLIWRLFDYYYKKKILSMRVGVSDIES